MKRVLAIVLLLCAVFESAPPARAGVLSGEGIGAYGDSMTMQYSLWLPMAPDFGYSIFYNGTQLNWVDQLVQSGYNFGPLVNLGPGANYNSYDGGVAGDTTADLANQVQYLAPYVSAGNVGLVVLNMGANDVGNEYSTIYNNAANHSYVALNDPAVQSFINTVMSNITSAVNATLAENPATKMILTTIPDVGVTPQYHTSYPKAAQRAAVTPVVQALNADIIALAKAHGFPVVDLYGMANLANNPPKVAGIQFLDAGGKTGNDLFLSDGFHPGTVVQGMLANAVLQADAVAYHDTVSPISDQTILTRAGLTPKGASPTFFNASPYVIYTPLPEPSALALAALCAVGYGVMSRTRRRTAAA